MPISGAFGRCLARVWRHLGTRVEAAIFGHIHDTAEVALNGSRDRPLDTAGNAVLGHS